MLIPRSASKSRRASIPTALFGLAILAAGVAAALYVYVQVDRSGRVHVLDRAATIAAAVPQGRMEMLAGDESDLGTPPYEELKSFLARMRSVNHDARFLYLIGESASGALFFYADSESVESPDYSPPGQIYYEATPVMRAFFEDGTPRTEGPGRDRWGFWISGYAPVVDERGDVIAMLGMDLPADRFVSDAVAYSLLPVLASFLVLSAVIAMERSRRRERAYVEQEAEFLSIASHEIRTPLTGIRWAIEGLLSRENPPIHPKTRAVLALVHESCLGLIGRVNNLLDLTALDDSRRTTETIDIPSFLEDIADSLALSAQQRSIRIALDDSVVHAGSFRADRQMMHHAFFNLLTNAVKYTRAGTVVTVSYEEAEGNHVFRVSDQGDGISLEDQERIFAGYYRSEAAVRSGQFGSGLGLYLAKKAAELHGGTIRVMSVPGEGATFVLSVPAMLSRSSR